MLLLKDVKKSFQEPGGGQLPILDVPSFAVGEGEQLALVGQSGGGKTTLLRIIAGITRPDAGQVEINGRDITRLPEVARAEIDGVRVAVVHETGAATGRERRMDAAFPDADLLVFGHSHIPWDSVAPGGLRLLNPGSPTDRRRQPVATFMTAIARRGRLEEVRLVPVDPAWREPER